MTHPSQRGQALIIIALAVVGIVGMVGLVVDGGQAFLDRRSAQLLLANRGPASARGRAAERERVLGPPQPVPVGITQG